MPEFVFETTCLLIEKKSTFTVFVNDHTNRDEFERIQEHVERVIPKLQGTTRRMKFLTGLR